LEEFGGIYKGFAGIPLKTKYLNTIYLPLFPRVRN